MILFVIAIFSLGKQGNHAATPAPTDLSNHTTDGSVVTLVIEGPVEADELHTALTISISAGARSIEGDATYQNQPINSQTYTNNQAAFNDFMQALQNAGFTKATKGKTVASELGMCPLGNRYVYELAVSEKVTQRLWSDSCGDRTATFNGEGPLVRSLFEHQIPNYTKFTQSLSQP